MSVLQSDDAIIPTSVGTIQLNDKMCVHLWLVLSSSVLKCLSEVWEGFVVFQLVMQYLYCGGTESLHIRNTEVMEVLNIPLSFLLYDHNSSYPKPFLPATH